MRRREERDARGARREAARQPARKLAARGFEVFSFDPTAKTRADHERFHEPHIHFRYWGLASADVGCRDKSARHGGTYGELGGDLLSLTQIRRRLGHQNRSIAALKIVRGPERARTHS